MLTLQSKRILLATAQRHSWRTAFGSLVDAGEKLMPKRNAQALANGDRVRDGAVTMIFELARMS